jgi:histidinol dehydrogenase
VGNYSPEPLGDYFAGPSHVLPTSGGARSFSALSADSFTKKISLINYSKDMLNKVKDDIIEIAECEGLTAHADAVRVRFAK